MSTSTFASPQWTRILRQRKLIVIGAVLSLLLTFALIAQISGADPLRSFSRLAEHGIPAVSDAHPHGVVNGLDGPSDGLEKVLGPIMPSEEEGFTLVVPTYKRLKDLPKFLEHYAEGNITSLRKIILLWVDLENGPPQDFLSSLDKYQKVPVIVEHPRDKSLNQRFRRSENIKTEAVLSLDDDMLFEPYSIQLGFDAWKQYGQGRRRMVGYVAREVGKDGSYMVGGFQSYSIVLTKCSFFHVDWMDAYWSEDPTLTELRSFVDQHNNCEDILMSFLHAHHTRVAPVFMDAPFKDTGLVKGISTEPGHLKARSACVREFKEKFGNDTLVSSTLVLSKMKHWK